MTLQKKGSWKRVFLYLFVYIVAVVILYPYFVMFTTGAKSTDEMYAGETILPKVWQWSNFVDIWKQAPIFKFMLNSIIVSGGATFLAILCGIPAA